MRRRELITLLGGAAAWPLTNRAQALDQVRRIGVLMALADDPEGQARLEAFRTELQRLGWSENKNVRFTYRAPSDASQARVAAKEMIELKPDLIFAHSTPLTLAVKEATDKIPIVFVQVSDPVASGMVASLAKPGAISPDLLTTNPP
jgi:putative ABC transport system substrate-binding protein